MGAWPTPGAILDFWIGPAIDDHLAAARLHKLWFIKSADTDRFIETHYGPLLNALSAGLAEDWAADGARSRLAAIIALDQFSRNIFRGTPAAFAQDALALKLARTAIETDEHAQLSEIERSFLYLPFEHSESVADQDQAVALFDQLAADARPSFKPVSSNSLDYAHQHREVIRKFGRFPHRNAILGRENTAEEADYLAKPGSGF